MPTINIPLTTLTPNQVIDSSVVPQLTQPVGTNTNLLLTLNRNVGAASLDITVTASITITGQWSSDGGTTWNPGVSALIPGGILFADKAHTIQQETSSVQWQWPQNTTHIRGAVANGVSPVSVSGSLVIS